MIRFIVGVPGSGKTYYAVNSIYQAVNDRKNKDKYLVIYTNINQFDFKISDKVKPYNHDEIYKRLERLHKHYKKKATDEKLIKLARRFGVYKALFVIDEAHNIFDVKNPVLVWWLSYHRHLYQDIDLITQNLSLIESKYKGFTEYFVRALPQSLRLFSKNFTYRLYIDSRMTQKGRAGTETVKFNPDVFKLYHSGDKPKTKNIIVRYLLIAFLFLLPTFGMFYYVKSSWSSKTLDETKSVVAEREPVAVASDSVPESRPKTRYIDMSEDAKLLNLVCVSVNCEYEGVVFPLSVLKKLIESTESKLLSVETDYRTMQTNVYMLASDRFQKLFKGVKNEISADLDIFGTSRKSE